MEYAESIFITRNNIKLFNKFGETNLKEEDFSPSIQESIIEINTPINWVELAQKYGLTYAQLRASNVWIRDLILTNRMNKTYRVNIPNKADFKYDCARIKVHDSNWIK